MKTTCECGHEIEYTREDIKGTVHYVLCGDATVEADVAKLMAGAKADLVFTDPPYGMGLDTDFSLMTSKRMLWKNMKGGRKYEKVIGDDKPFDPAFLMTVFTCHEQFWWGADYYADRIPDREKGSWIVWDKRLEESVDKMYGSCFELCWSKARHKREIARIKWAGVWGTEKEFDRKRYHPTQKPIALVMWFLEKHAGQIVADPFGGSGSTLIACEKLNRKCRMMEIDTHYSDVIINRWQNFTGKQAELQKPS